MKKWLQRLMGTEPGAPEPKPVRVAPAVTWSLRDVPQNAPRRPDRSTALASLASLSPRSLPAPSPPAPARGSLPDAAVLMARQPSSDRLWLHWLTAPVHTRLQDDADSTALSPAEAAALALLDQQLADTRTHGQLLPRGPAVVPQLLARLRSNDCSLVELAQHVSRDITLVAEVIAMANSPFYRRGDAVLEVGHAIRALGIDGLRSAIARALFKPVADGRGNAAAAARADRLWRHTDRKAQLCALIARGQQQEPFDAYLLGLLHNAVCTPLLRALDAAMASTGPAASGPARWSRAWAAALNGQRHRRLAIAARQWTLTERLVPVADELAQQGLASTASVALRLLFTADQLAGMAGWPHDDPAQVQAADEAAAAPLLTSLPAEVQAVWRAMRTPAALPSVGPSIGPSVGPSVGPSTLTVAAGV